MKNKLLPVLQIVVNVSCIPLYFIEFIVGVGHLPVEGGGVVEKRFYHSPFENLHDECAWLFYLSLSMIAAAVLCSVIALVGKNRAKWRKVSLIVSVSSLVAAFLIILFSTTVARGY